MANPSPDEGVRAGEWLTTAPNPNSSPFGFNGGQRGWKLHYVQGERAACGITARHGWGLDLHIETRCARCEAALAALSTPVPVIPMGTGDAIREALGAHIQADAYRDSFPDDDADLASNRQSEAWWRLKAREWTPDGIDHECAEAAKARILRENGNG